MGGPFQRGQNDYDWLFSVLAQRACDWGDTTDLGAVASLLGYRSATLFNFPGGAFPRVAVIVCDDAAFFVCGSTRGAIQWIGNVLGSAAVQYPQTPGTVAAYFGAVAATHWAAAGPTFTAAAAGRTPVFVGFSLGGASAAICAARYAAAAGRTPSVVTFGCPRPGLSDFAAACPTQFLSRFTLVNDPVGSVPPIPWTGDGRYAGWTPFPPFVTYVQPGDGWTLGLGGELTPGDFVMPLEELILSFDVGLWVQFHSQYQYARAIRRRMPDQIPDGAEGYPSASRFDGVAGSLFGPSYPPWPFVTVPDNGPEQDEESNVIQFSAYFRDTTQPLGFQEVYYFTGSDPDAVMSWWTTGSIVPMTKRMEFASSTLQHYAYRATIVGDPRKGRYVKMDNPQVGVNSPHTDIEACIVYVGFSGDFASKRFFHFRGIPAGWITTDAITDIGRYYLPKFATYMNLLILNGLTLAVPSASAWANLQTAAQSGVGQPITVTADNSFAVAANNLVQIRSCKAAPILNGRWKVVGNSTSSNVFTLSGSQRYSAPAMLNGQVRQILGLSNTPMGSYQFNGVGSKKTGRPSFLQRGRRSPQLRRR